MLAFLTLSPAAQAAAPANDNFANATVIDGTSLSQSTTNVEATIEAGEPNHGVGGSGASVWWSWQAPVSGDVVIDTCGSAIDTLLAVYTGVAVNALTLVTRNDDSAGCGGNGRQSALRFTAAAGTT